MDWGARFAAFSARKTAESSRPLERVRTVTDSSDAVTLDPIGDEWSAAAFDGPFFQSPASTSRPSVGIVFVTSAAGDTATGDPSSLGAGAVDDHLIYEGLTRVACDAVIVGAGTLHDDAFFSVWRPELVALRSALGLARHPVQIVMSASGSFDPGGVLLFNVPSARVIVLTSPDGEARLADGLVRRPWVQIESGPSLERQFQQLARAGVRRVSCVGGRHSATALIDAGLVDDVYLTSAPLQTAQPGTPWYAGSRPPELRSVLLKEWESDHGRVTFGHWVVSPCGSGPSRALL